jgi:flagellar motility protein MotE (MotC chaperone)
MKSVRDIRIIPVVVVAIFGFAVLKIAGLVIDGGYVFEYQPDSSTRSWAQNTLNFPTGKADASDITGSLDEKKEQTAKSETAKSEAVKSEPARSEAARPETTRPEVPKLAAPAVEMAQPDAATTFPSPEQPVSASERAILERLKSRRQELDARAREMDIRESLLKAAEKRVESRVQELKGVESQISTATEQKSEAEAARFKGIVTMYEAMKPKDAAKVFDRLEMPVLIQIASQIAPRKMSDILGLMSPEAAERLTVEMARRASPDKAASAELPKIEGKMLQQKPN